MESAHRVIDEAHYVIEQYRQGLPRKQIIEIRNRTMNPGKTKHTKRKNGGGNIVAFQLYPTGLKTDPMPDSMAEEAKEYPA
jgi:hypothetical protein